MLLNCTNLPDVPLYHVIGIVGQQVPIYLMSHYTSNMMKCVECMLPEAPMIPTENVTSLNENQSILGSLQTSAALTQFKPIPQSNIICFISKSGSSQKSSKVVHTDFAISLVLLH